MSPWLWFYVNCRSVSEASTSGTLPKLATSIGQLDTLWGCAMNERNDWFGNCRILYSIAISGSIPSDEISALNALKTLWVCTPWSEYCCLNSSHRTLARTAMSGTVPSEISALTMKLHWVYVSMSCKIHHSTNSSVSGVWSTLQFRGAYRMRCHHWCIWQNCKLQLLTPGTSQVLGNRRAGNTKISGSIPDLSSFIEVLWLHITRLSGLTQRYGDALQCGPYSGCCFRHVTKDRWQHNNLFVEAWRHCFVWHLECLAS